ncbi:M23 family metallopeptidase [Thiomicrospira pelophila]|uniref:M23 family metallopeptidase n=1 Tax=Thiomicrospira pelophila TaxID=934 RepID=UPI0004A6CC71|nr:M23 family metallopeptidase [Thiomicrospira pelophila]
MQYEEINPFCRALQWISLAFLITLPVNLAHAKTEFKTQILELPTQLKESTNSTEQLAQSTSLNKFEFIIRPNQTLSHALDKVADTAQTALKISQSNNSELFTNLRVGDKLVIWTDTDNQLQKIDMDRSRILSYHLEKKDDQFRIYENHKVVDTKIKMSSATIHDSFYIAGETAGLSPRTIMNLADLFAWEVDFVRELRSGDELKIIYEQRYLNDEFLGDGNILAAELTVGGQRKVRAFRLEIENQLIGYYDENGQNLRKAFMRNPINYTRISSRFQRGRHHPVLQETRDHRGVDYAAPTGTPIYAAGDGVISYKGWNGGYGKKVVIKHAGRYETVYAHLSRYGKAKRGQSVKQGDIIGYVGKTGLATGPHLHYEFRINGVHRDPLKVKFPDAEPVLATYRNDFDQYASIMHSQLTRFDPELTQLALNFE